MQKHRISDPLSDKGTIWSLAQLLMVQLCMSLQLHSEEAKAGIYNSHHQSQDRAAITLSRSTRSCTSAALHPHERPTQEPEHVGVHRRLAAGLNR